jgi:hypothetical protein
MVKTNSGAGKGESSICDNYLAERLSLPWNLLLLFCHCSLERSWWALINSIQLTSNTGDNILAFANAFSGSVSAGVGAVIIVCNYKRQLPGYSDYSIIWSTQSTFFRKQ